MKQQKDSGGIGEGNMRTEQGHTAQQEAAEGVWVPWVPDILPLPLVLTRGQAQ